MTQNNKEFLLGGEIAVNRVGFGSMRLTGQPGNFGPYADWDAGKAVLRRAIELGVTFIDTARSYGPGWSERLVADALHPYAPGVVIATKGGIDKTSATEMRVDGRPASLAAHVDESLRDLNVDRIDLYQLHRVDPHVDIEESVGALRDLQRDGRIRLIGLSNVTEDQIKRAMSVAQIASVQNRYNIAETTDDALIDFTAERQIAFIPYGPLGAHPMRPGGPLAEGEPTASASPAQRALKALLDRSPNIIVIPGTTSVRHLEQNVGSWDISN